LARDSPRSADRGLYQFRATGMRRERMVAGGPGSCFNRLNTWEEAPMNKPACRVFPDYGPEEAAMQAYFREGEARAMALGNRDPIRFGPDGKLDPAILASYNEHGFYVFEGVLKPEELADI